MGRFFDVIAKYSGVTKQELLAEMSDVDTYEDLELKFELHIDDYFIRSGVCTVIDTAYEEEVVKINFNFGTKDYLSNEMNINFKVDEYSDAQVVIAAYNNLGESGNLVKQGFEASLTVEEETAFIDFNTSYDTKAKDDNYEMSLQGEFPYAGSIDVKGIGTKGVSGKEVSTILDDLTCKVEDYYGDVIQAKFAVSYGAKSVKAKDVKFTSKQDVKYILELSMAELMAMVQTVQNNVQSIGSSLLQ